MALTSNCIPIYQELPLDGEEFSDLPRQRYPDDPTMDFITRVMYSGLDMNIIDGYAHDHSAGPLNPATRAQTLKILLNASGVIDSYTNSDAQVYQDVDSGDWFYEYVQYAAYNDITMVWGETSENYFYPYRDVMRSEAVAIDTRIMHKSLRVDDSIKQLIENTGLLISNAEELGVF